MENRQHATIAEKQIKRNNSWKTHGENSLETDKTRGLLRNKQNMSITEEEKHTSRSQSEQ